MTTAFKLLLFTVGVFYSICFYALPASAQRRSSISPEAKKYLENALDIMHQNSLLKREVDWAKLRRETLEKAANAQETIDTWEAIRFALQSIGDHHSFLQLEKSLREKEIARRRITGEKVAAAAQQRPSPFSSRRKPESIMHKTGECFIAQIVVPLYISQQGDDFATALKEMVASADAQNPCGWIVDLRGNGGGNIFPMIAGIGALLGEGNTHYSLDADGGKTFYFYRQGQSGLTEPDGKESIITKVTGEPYVIKKQLPLAVLIDKGTGSSGEGIAVAFRGRERTRFFGSHTYGVSTSNEGFMLSDGANIVLTTGVAVDSSGKIYMNGIEPDEKTEVSDKIVAPSEDAALQTAIAWLLKQKPMIMSEPQVIPLNSDSYQSQTKLIPF